MLSVIMLVVTDSGPVLACFQWGFNYWTRPVSNFFINFVIVTYLWAIVHWAAMGLLPDTQNCRLRMRRECRERFLHHWLQRKPLVNDSGMHHGTYVTHMPWCISGSLNRGGGGNVLGIPGACATRDFAYLVRGPWWSQCAKLIGYLIPRGVN